jgi:hypothetical protein
VILLIFLVNSLLKQQSTQLTAMKAVILHEICSLCTYNAHNNGFSHVCVYIRVKKLSCNQQNKLETLNKKKAQSTTHKKNVVIKIMAYSQCFFFQFFKNFYIREMISILLQRL